MKKKNNRTKKSQNQFIKYKNMVKAKTEDEYTEENPFLSDLQGTNEVSSNSTIDNKEQKVEEPPLGYKIKEFWDTYSAQIIITLILGLGAWSVALQIGQATQNEKMQNMEEDIKEIKSLLNDKYVIKDVYDIQIENLKEKVDELENELNNNKN